MSWGHCNFVRFPASSGSSAPNALGNGSKVKASSSPGHELVTRTISSSGATVNVPRWKGVATDLTPHAACPTHHLEHSGLQLPCSKKNIDFSDSNPRSNERWWLGRDPGWVGGAGVRESSGSLGHDGVGRRNIVVSRKCRAAESRSVEIRSGKNFVFAGLPRKAGTVCEARVEIGLLRCT